MGIDIRTGDAVVVASGTVTAFGGAGFHIVLALEEGTFLVDFHFHTDQADPEVRVETWVEGQQFRFDLYNFDGADGRGSAIPVAVGVAGATVVYVHFRVFRYGRTADRTLHYTFYRAVGNPWPTTT